MGDFSALGFPGALSGPRAFAVRGGRAREGKQAREREPHWGWPSHRPAIAVEPKKERRLHQRQPKAKRGNTTCACFGLLGRVLPVF